MNAEITESTPAPAGPVTDRQRTFLRRLIDRTEELKRALDETISIAQGELSSLAAGSARPSPIATTMIRSAGEVMALRAEIETRAQMAGAYDVTKDQVRHAVALASTGSSLDDAVVSWLYGNAEN